LNRLPPGTRALANLAIHGMAHIRRRRHFDAEETAVALRPRERRSGGQDARPWKPTALHSLLKVG
jgi:hypothetical protein